MIDDADVDSANPEILTVQEDEEGDEDGDVEIGISRFTMYVISWKQWAWLHLYVRYKISFSLKSVFNFL